MSHLFQEQLFEPIPFRRTPFTINGLLINGSPWGRNVPGKDKPHGALRVAPGRRVADAAAPGPRAHALATIPPQRPYIFEPLCNLRGTPRVDLLIYGLLGIGATTGGGRGGEPYPPIIWPYMR